VLWNKNNLQTERAPSRGHNITESKEKLKAFLNVALTNSASEESSSNNLMIGRISFEACETASFFVFENLDSLVSRSEIEVHEATRTILELAGFLRCDNKLLNQTEYDLKKRSELHS
jgi:hypothetical protein